MHENRPQGAGSPSQTQELVPASPDAAVGRASAPRRRPASRSRAAAAAGGNWYVAQVLSQKEGYAVEHLARQGFQTFCPRLHRTRSHARRRDTVLVPLFPGYIFVKFDIEADRWLSINSTQGVIRLVGPRLSAPSAVSPELIDLLMSRCTAGVLTKLPEYIQPGHRIQITAGALAGQIATIEALDDRGRVRVLLSLLGAEHNVAVRADQLAPVAAT
jgi:transcription elongation factor/antiterminator RfaH